MKKIYEMIVKIKTKLYLQMKNLISKINRRHVSIALLILIIASSATLGFVVGMHNRTIDNEIMEEVIIEPSQPNNETEPNNNVENNKNEQIVEKPENEIKTGNMNEWVDNNEYAVMVDRIFEIDGSPFQPADGYMFVAVHFSIKNISTKSMQIFEKQVDLVVNDYTQTYKIVFNYKEIPTNFVSPGAMVEGYRIFEMPKNPDGKIIVKYGEFININCDVNMIEYLTQ